MFQYIIGRLLFALCVALTVSFLSFFLIFLTGDPAAAVVGPSGTDQDIESARKLYGFDKPIVVQFVQWLSRAIQGDFGLSFFFKIPVSEILIDRIPVTLQLGLSAILASLALSIPLGVVAALQQGTWVDRLCLILAVIGQALPSFWFGLILIVVFGLLIGVLPTSGSESWQHYILPTIVLVYYTSPAIMRLTRSGMIEVLGSDYIRTAYAKGLRKKVILFRHALRNAIIPVVSLSAAQFGYMLAGSVVVESVFAIHGIGSLAWESILRGDLPTVQAIILLLSCIYVGLTAFADILNSWFDPRLRNA